jgi:hypothetical protein
MKIPGVELLIVITMWANVVCWGNFCSSMMIDTNNLGRLNGNVAFYEASDPNPEQYEIIGEADGGSYYREMSGQ